MKKEIEYLNKYVLAQLIASDIGKKNNEYYSSLLFREQVSKSSFIEYRKFHTLKGESLQIAIEDYGNIGHSGNITNICNQGIHNKSTVLDFGKEFEIELVKVNGKISIGNIRRPGDYKLRTSVSVGEAEAALKELLPTKSEE